MHDYDLAVLSSAAALDSSVIVRPIVVSQTVFCASPEYLRGHGEPMAPEDLLQHRCLRLRLAGSRLGPLRLIDPTRQDHEIELDVPAALVANHTDTLVRATLDGGGISSQPIDLLAPMIRAGRLKRVLSPWITARVAMVAALPSRQYMPARTRAFVDCLVEHTRSLIDGLAVDAPQP